MSQQTIDPPRPGLWVWMIVSQVLTLLSLGSVSDAEPFYSNFAFH